MEVIDAHLARIEATEPTLNSFITLLPDRAEKRPFVPNPRFRPGSTGDRCTGFR